MAGRHLLAIPVLGYRRQPNLPIRGKKVRGQACPKGRAANGTFATGASQPALDDSRKSLGEVGLDSIDVCNWMSGLVFPERTWIVAGRSSQENTQGAARVRQATPRRLHSGFGWFSLAFAHRKKLRKELR